MLSLRTCLMAGVAGIGIAIAGATGASATPLVMTLDPSKTNLPAGGIIDPATAAFMTDGAVFGGGSLIDIAGTGAGISSFQKGNFNIASFQLGGSNSPSNVNQPGHYQIFGTYFISTSYALELTCKVMIAAEGAESEGKFAPIIFELPETNAEARAAGASAG